MRYITLFSAAVLLLFASLFSACQTRKPTDNNVVAVIGEKYTIDSSALREYAQASLLDRVYENPLDAYTIALNRMIVNQLKRIDFFEAGLHKDEELVHSIRRIINEEMVGEYFRKKFLAQYVNEEAIRHAYENMGYRTTYRQIVLLKPPDDSSSFETVRLQATKIKQMLDDGSDFAALAEQFSQHAESASRGGYMPPITWSHSLRTPMDRQIYELTPGDVHIIESYNAFHIVEVTDKERIHIRSFEEEKEHIRQILENQYMTKSLLEFDRAKQATVTEADLEWNMEALTQLVVWSDIEGFYHEHYPHIMQQEIDKGNNFTIVRAPQQTIDLKELKRLLDEVLIPRARGRMSIEDFKRFLVEAMRSDQMVRKARALNLEDEVFNIKTNNHEIRYWLIRLYNKRFIEDQLPEPTYSALRQFYEERKDSLFYQFESAGINLLITHDATEADRWRQMLDDGADFEDLANEWLIRAFLRDHDGQIRSTHGEEFPEIAAVVFDMTPGEVLGPVLLLDKDAHARYAIVQCRSRHPARQLPFEEVQMRVEEEFIRYHRRNISQAVERTLREKYHVTVYDDVLKRVATGGL